MTSKEDQSDKITKETGKITIDDFMKVDLRVGIIEEAKEIYGMKEIVPSIILVEDLSRNKN